MTSSTKYLILRLAIEILFANGTSSHVVTLHPKNQVIYGFIEDFSAFETSQRLSDSLLSIQV
jgi:uncharacterized membrane protein